MARRIEPQVFVATESGSAEVNGEAVTFVKGVTRLRAGHAILAQLPDFFEPADGTLSYDAEDASAAPGEKRGAVVVGQQNVAAAVPASQVADPRDLTTLASVKLLMQKGGANAAGQDALIAQEITRASVKIMDDYGREFVPGGSYSLPAIAAPRTFEFPTELTNEAFVDLYPYDLQMSPDPTVTIDSDLSSTTTLTSDQWRLWPRPASQGVFSAIRVSLWTAHAAWPRFSHRQMTVTGNWGFPSIPEQVKQACDETVVHWITAYPAARRADQVDSASVPVAPRSYPMTAIDLLKRFERVVV